MDGTRRVGIFVVSRGKNIELPTSESVMVLSRLLPTKRKKDFVTFAPSDVDPVYAALLRCVLHC